jgi:hypothetical protein
MKLTVMVFLSLASILVAAVDAEKEEAPNNIADSVGSVLHGSEDQFLAAAEAMPESKYDFVPTAGNFEGVRARSRSRSSTWPALISRSSTKLKAKLRPRTAKKVVPLPPEPSPTS